MAITTAMCNSFKQEILGGVHDLDTDVLKLALIVSVRSVVVPFAIKIKNNGTTKRKI